MSARLTRFLYVIGTFPAIPCLNGRMLIYEKHIPTLSSASQIIVVSGASLRRPETSWKAQNAAELTISGLIQRRLRRLEYVGLFSSTLHLMFSCVVQEWLFQLEARSYGAVVYNLVCCLFRHTLLEKESGDLMT